MRMLFLTCLFAFLLPSLAQAEASLGAPDSATLAAQPLRMPSNLVPAGQGPFTRPPANRHIQCCSRKGALIGFAVGAGSAFLLTRYLCDAGDCFGTYVKSVALLAELAPALVPSQGAPA